MVGQSQMSMGGAPLSTNDPNEMLKRIDQTTMMTFHWVRIGVIVSILLLVAILLGF